MVSCKLLSHGSQAVQTSSLSMAKILMDTCGMWYIVRFAKIVCSCNFVICTIKYTHTCALGTGFKLVNTNKCMERRVNKLQYHRGLQKNLTKDIILYCRTTHAGNCFLTHPTACFELQKLFPSFHSFPQ
jgi:hypothetical protein